MCFFICLTLYQAFYVMGNQYNVFSASRREDVQNVFILLCSGFDWWLAFLSECECLYSAGLGRARAEPQPSAASIAVLGPAILSFYSAGLSPGF